MGAVIRLIPSEFSSLREELDIIDSDASDRAVSNGALTIEEMLRARDLAGSLKRLVFPKIAPRAPLEPT